MADETHASIPDRYRSGRSERAGCVTLGLIPAPDIPETMARELAPQLPKLLENRVDGDVSWEVPVLVDPLTGTDGRPRRSSTSAARGCLARAGTSLSA